MDRDLRWWLDDLERTVLKAVAHPSPDSGTDGYACVKAIKADDGRGVMVMIVSGPSEVNAEWMEKALAEHGAIVDRIESPDEPPPLKLSIQ